MTLWSATNGGFRVEVDDLVLREMAAQRDAAGLRETGGILVGSYATEGTLAQVLGIRGSTSSRGWFSRFRRGVGGLQQHLATQWDKGRYYLGEWHSHPRGGPHPSRQDDRQMHSIAASAGYACPEPILMIVGDGPSYGLFIYANGQRITLLAEHEDYLLPPEEDQP